MKESMPIKADKLLPFGKNFRFVDSIIDYCEGEFIVTQKRVNKKDWFFKGHFPGRPVMPGHLIAEAMAQSCVLYFGKHGKKSAGRFFYMASSKTRFFNVVKPGNVLTIRVYPTKIVTKAGIFRAEVYVRDQLVAKGEFSVAVKK